MAQFFVEGEGSAASVLWRPELCTQVLRLHAIPDRLTEVVLRIDDLLSLPHLAAAVGNGYSRGQWHHLHLLYCDGARQLQVEITGPSATGPLQLMLPAIIDSRNLCRQHEGLRAFNALLTCGRLPKAYDRPALRSRRLVLVRAALDSWLAGRSQRDTAVALFGAVRVERDWSDPGEHCRDQVRRAISCGRRLMAGGYRSLLA